MSVSYLTLASSSSYSHAGRPAGPARLTVKQSLIGFKSCYMLLSSLCWPAYLKQATVYMLALSMLPPIESV